MGPTLVNISTRAEEQGFFSDCPSEFRRLLYHRYVDENFSQIRVKPWVFSSFQIVSILK